MDVRTAMSTFPKPNPVVLRTAQGLMRLNWMFVFVVVVVVKLL